MTNQKSTQQSAMRRFFSSRLFLILLFVVAILVAFSYARAYYQDYAIRQEIKQLNEEVQNLQRKKLESFELLKYVSSDEYVEEQGRTEFNMKKPGENVIALPEDTGFAKPEIEASFAQEDDVPLNNPKKWWYYIMHIQTS